MNLHFKGNKKLLEMKKLAVVGTRNPTEKAVKAAHDTAEALKKAGMCLVSGLARGIDTVVIKAALDCGCPVIAVIGTPLSLYYPPENRVLQDRVAREGLLISPFSDREEVKPYFFIKRNGVIAELSDASFVVEDRDGGGGVNEALQAYKKGKPVFILSALADRNEFTWPYLFPGAKVIQNISEIAPLMYKQDVQLTLF